MLFREMGVKPLPHFENPLHTFAMQYKIKVQRNCETICLLSRNMVDLDKTDAGKKQISYREEEIPDCECIYG